MRLRLSLFELWYFPVGVRALELTKRLIIFLKAPRPGQVKTRLARDLGPASACVAYTLLVRDLLAEVSDFADVELRYTPDDALFEIGPWLKGPWRAAPQGNGDLGRRLDRAFSDSFDRGAGRTVVIGSDCPYLERHDIDTAWRQLADCPLVLGPAVDGGYWLIGLSERVEALFEGIPWSTGEVFERTVQRAKASGIKTALLRELEDVDTVEAWSRYRSRIRKGKGLASGHPAHIDEARSGLI